MPYDPKLSHFDLDFKRGAQGQLFVEDVCKALADGSGRIEVKTDAKFFITGNLYIEYACFRRGKWVASGLADTEAQMWAYKFGMHPGLLVFSVEWLLRAARQAYKNPKRRTSMDYGKNPTKGVLVSFEQLAATRDVSLDEHV